MVRYRYYKEHGSFYYRDEKGLHIQLMADEVAVGFLYSVAEDGSDDVTIMRHGSPESVERWWKSVQGLAPELGTPMMVSSSQWDVERLNFYLHCPGGFGAFLRGMGLLGPTTPLPAAPTPPG